MKKRVVSLLLCLIMALSLIPTAAFATDDVPDANNTPDVQAATDEVAVQKTDNSKIIDSQIASVSWTPAR